MDAVYIIRFNSSYIYIHSYFLTDSGFVFVDLEIETYQCKNQWNFEKIFPFKGRDKINKTCKRKQRKKKLVLLGTKMSNCQG